MRKITIIFLINCLSFLAYANDPISEKQQALIAKFLKQQAKQHNSVEKSVSAILHRHPERVEEVITVALDLYPEQHMAIMQGAIHAEPAISCEVIDIFIKSDISEISEIVKLAIELEPAYANEIVETAAQYHQDQIEEIVRVAIKTDPFVTDSLVSNTMASYPEKMLDILTSAILAIPDQITNIVQGALDLFPTEREEVIATAVSTVNEAKLEKTDKIVKAAIESGVAKEEAIAAAIKGGANRELLLTNISDK